MRYLIEYGSLANYTAVTTLTRLMAPNEATPKDVQREANVLQVQRWWKEHQESDAVSVRATEELFRIAILERVAPELLVDPPTHQQLILL